MNRFQPLALLPLLFLFGSSTQASNYSEGLQEWSQSNYTAAAEHLLAALETAPNSFEAHYFLSLSQRRLGENDAALRSVERALALNAQHTRARVHRIRLLLDGSNSSDALGASKDLVEAAPECSVCWEVRGRAVLAVGDLPATVDALQTAVSLNDQSGLAWNLLGLARIRAKDFEAALTPLERATKLLPEQSFVFNNLGVAYESLQRSQEAESAYRRAVELSHPHAAKSLARVISSENYNPDGEVLESTEETTLATISNEVRR